MAAAKKPATKRKIQAHDIEVGSRTLDAVLADLAEVNKECAVRSARAEERSARAEERSARAEERSARAEERSARAEELAQLALTTIGSVLQDLRLLAGRTDDRLTALENAAAE
jgi:hypothetical protein